MFYNKASTICKGWSCRVEFFWSFFKRWFSSGLNPSYYLFGRRPLMVFAWQICFLMRFEFISSNPGNDWFPTQQQETNGLARSGDQMEIIRFWCGVSNCLFIFGGTWYVASQIALFFSCTNSYDIFIQICCWKVWWFQELFFKSYYFLNAFKRSQLNLNCVCRLTPYWKRSFFLFTVSWNSTKKKLIFCCNRSAGKLLHRTGLLSIVYFYGQSKKKIV